MSDLKFNIHTPCTVEAIQAEKLANQSDIKWVYFVLRLLGLGLFWSVVLYFLGVIPSIMAPISVVLLMLVVTVYLCSDVVEVEEVPDAECGRLLEACIATPEGQRYREAVLAQGRKFLAKEAEMIYAWTNQKDTRLNCKKLYDIPA